MTGLMQPVAARTDLRDVLGERTAIARRAATVLSLPRGEFVAWQIEALSQTVGNASRNSAFYRERIERGTARRVEAADLDAFREIPFTTRDDIMRAYPLGLLACPRERVIRFGESSGTSTGQSIAAFFTMSDWVTNNCTVAHFLSAVLTAEDVAAVAVPYELAGVGQDLDRALELIGCSVVSFGGPSAICPPERMVEVIESDGVTTLVCSGTRALYLAEIARRSGRDPRSGLRVDKLLMAGEGASPAKRQKLSDIWGAATYSMFGMTETNTLAMFCSLGKLHLVENRTWFEVVDPDSGVTLPDGQPGELTVTSLASEAMPLVRYRTGDMCRIGAASCPCGSVYRTLQHMGRVSDRVVVGARSLSQLRIEDAVMRHLSRPPYYFAFAADDPELVVGLAETNLDDATTSLIAAEIQQSLDVPARFTDLKVNEFEKCLRESVKPTIGNFQL